MRIWMAGVVAVAGCASIAELGEFTDEGPSIVSGSGGGTTSAGGGSTTGGAGAGASGQGGATTSGGAGGAGGSTSSTAMAMCPEGSTPGTTMGTCLQTFLLDAEASGMIEVSENTCPPTASPVVSKTDTLHVIYQGSTFGSGGTNAQERDGFLSFDVDLPVPENQIISATLRLVPDTIFNPDLPPGIEVQAFGGTQPLYGELGNDDFAVAGVFLDGMSASQAQAMGEATLQIPGDQIQLGGVPTQFRLTLNANCPYPNDRFEFDYIISVLPPELEVLFLP